MKKLIEMMADAQFFLFVLGLLGVPFFNKIHELLTKCNPTVFQLCLCHTDLRCVLQFTT